MTKLISLRKFLKLQFGYLFQYQRIIFRTKYYRLRIRNKIRSNPQFKDLKRDKKYLNKSKQFLKNNFFGYNNTNWHHYFSTITKIKKVEFIPDDLFFNQIEPTLNNNSFSEAICDKLSYDNTFQKKDIPTTVFKILNGNFYNDENTHVERKSAFNQLNLLTESLILKPARISGGGSNIIVDTAQNISSLLNSKAYLKGSYILQKLVIQQKLMAQFHPASLNTCRIMTARVDSNIVVLSAYMRMGRNSNRVDNGQAGGIMCRIGENGHLDDYAIDKISNRFDKHPDTGIKFKGFIIPNYKQAKDFCLNHHKKFLRFTFISWDIGIRKDNSPVFIEFNPRHQAINGHQLINGPLFGEYTDYFIKRFNEEKDKLYPPNFII